MFGRKKDQHKKGLILVEVRNTYVRISSVYSDKKTVSILASKKYSTKNLESLIQKELYKTHLDASLADFVNTILPNIHTKHSMKTRDVMVVFSSPWYKAQMKHLKFKKDNPTIFTKKMYKDLVAQEPALNSENNLEKHTTHILLNEYELNDPFGKPATNIDIAFYVSTLDKSTRDVTEEVIDKHINRAMVHIHSSGFVNFQTIRNVFSNLSSFMFFDISADTTEIGVIKDNTFEILVTIPMGKKVLIESMAKECGLEKDTLVSSLNMMSRNELDDHCSVDILEVIQKEGTKWAKELGSVVEKLDEGEALPHKLFLFADSEVISFSRMLLKSDPIQENIFKTNSTDIMVLDKNNIGGDIIVSEDPSIKIDSLLLSKILFINSVEE